MENLDILRITMFNTSDPSKPRIALWGVLITPAVAELINKYSLLFIFISPLKNLQARRPIFGTV